MNLEDVIYVICLLVCIGAGVYVKTHTEARRKLLCTGIGLLMVCIVSGYNALHCIISTLLGIFVILKVHPSKCHLVAFGTMFGYLTFFRLAHLFGLPEPPGHTNMIQMMLTLKVAGVAFEKNASWQRLQQREKQSKERKENEEIVQITDYDVELQTLGASEIFHYAFNYIGVLTGPYYRYRTYRDYFELPFKDHAPNVAVTIDKLKYAGIYCVLYLVSNFIWPLSYAMSDEFYQDRSWIYRLMYIWPTFFIFRMRMYTGLTLSECVCTMAGFGAYPVEAESTNGAGPKNQYYHLKREAEKRSYNFTTIVNTRVTDVEKCWTFREGMKHWNICVQYWLAVNIYKPFPNKKFRTAATLLVSAYWHGFYPGHYFCIMGAPLYVPIEDMWNKLIRKDATGLKRHIIDCLFWVSKFFAFSYMGTAFLLVSFANIWRFYSSVYHAGYILWAVLAGLGIYLTKQQKVVERSAPRERGSGDDDEPSTSTSKSKKKAL